jgi:iron complex outermembrane receptor protein
MHSSYGWKRVEWIGPAAFYALVIPLTGSLMIAATSLLAPSAARAQAVTASQPGEGNEEPGLNEIVVTARKRVETMQSIPESIAAFGAQEITEAHIVRIDDLGNLVSNLNITTRADNTPDVVLRGVGSFGVVSGVGFYANDVQLFDGQSVRTDDIERIEVLKGPQGTLYGGSNVGGAIKYITKLPTDEFQAGTSVELGNNSTQTYSAFVSGPLVAGLDARASFFDSHTDGYIYDTALNRKVDGGTERGGRLTFLYKTDETTATLYLNYNWNSGGSGANIYYRPNSPTDYSLTVADGTEPQYLRGLYSATLKIDQRLSDGLNLTSISSYFHSYADVTVDIDKGPLPLLTGYQNFETDVGSQEVRLANSGDGALKWLVGVFAQANDPSVFTKTVAFNGPSNPANPPDFNDPTQYSAQNTDVVQRHREYALFGNISYDWAKWTFETGLRADYNDSSLEDPVYRIAGEQHGTEVLPKVSISYHFDKDVMGYGTVSRGFQPGDLVEEFDIHGNPYAGRYRPETTWNYELGLKSTFFDRLRFNAAVFYIDYRDRLFQTVALEQNQFVQLTKNIGASRNYGGEFDFSARLTQDLLFTTSFGVTKAIWGNVPYFDLDLNQPTNLSGRTAPYAPDYQGSVSLDWSHHLTENLTVGARADTTLVGHQYWDPTDHFQQPAHQLVNLGIRLEGAKWSVAGHVSNVFNKLYNTEYVSAAEVQAPFNVAGIGRPRLWTINLSYRW